MSAAAVTSGSESEGLTGGGIASSSQGSGCCHRWTFKDKAVLCSVGTMLLSAGAGICDILERSFWCHGAVCKDFESQHTKREVCNWVAVGLSGLAILSTITAMVFLYKSTKTTTIN